ncbi:hypothetical protein GC207_08205 [bacterium]|nr:hypothetical protein [bacterium]
MNTIEKPALADPPATHAPGLSTMEMMGVLMVRLIHDLSNQLTILAGNAQVLDMVRNNPERLPKVIDRIKTSSTNAGTLIDRFARLRQDIRFRTSPQPLAKCLEEVCAVNPVPNRWTIHSSDELVGSVALEPRWIAFCVWQIALLSRAARGQIVASEGGFPEDWESPAYAPTRLREGQLLRLEFQWQGPGPWLDEKEMAKPTDLSLAMAYEIFKIVDGWAHYQFQADDEHRFNLFFPLSR